MWRCHGSANLRFAGSIAKAGFNVKKRNDSHLAAMSAIAESVPVSSPAGSTGTISAGFTKRLESRQQWRRESQSMFGDGSNFWGLET
jgi:hypothetical protein